MANYLTSPRGSVSNETNKESIARIYGVKKSSVGILSTSTAIDSYSILYDKTTTMCFYRGNATGTPTSWSVSGNVLTTTTSAGVFTLYAASDMYLGDYSSGTITLINSHQYITYDSNYLMVTLYLKQGNVPTYHPEK